MKRYLPLLILLGCAQPTEPVVDCARPVSQMLVSGDTYTFPDTFYVSYEGTHFVEIDVRENNRLLLVLTVIGSDTFCTKINYSIRECSAVEDPHISK